MTTDTQDGVAIECRDGVLRITLDRPARKNSLDPVAVRRIVAALESAATDDTLRAVVLAGSGPDFCAGADWVAANTAGARPRTGSLQRRTPLQAHRLIELLTTLQLPVVCVVRGFAAGLGFQIALAADFTVAAESACFWEPFLQRGFAADSGSTWLLPRLVGIARAKELLLLGRKLSGTEAAAWGIVHRAVPDDQLDAAAEEIVTQLASAATVAVGLTKQCIHRSLETGLVDAMRNESFALELSSRTADFKEGLVAFKEKRPARFTGQ